METIKRYEWDQPDGTRSKAQSLSAAMDAARSHIRAGDGPFSVVSGIHARPGLTRSQAIRRVRTALGNIGVGVDVRVHKLGGDVVFHVWRAAVSTYLNPFRNIPRLGPERIDDGVDYIGEGPVHAMGPGVITLMGAGAGGAHVDTWSMDTFFVMQLTEGPAKGKYIYIAESVRRPQGVKTGDRVTTDTVVAYMNGGGIEYGWANPPGTVDSSLAHPGGSFTGVGGIQGEATCYGANMSQLLVALGAPAGLPNGQVHGKLPKSWPTNWGHLV